MKVRGSGHLGYGVGLRLNQPRRHITQRLTEWMAEHLAVIPQLSADGELVEERLIRDGRPPSSPERLAESIFADLIWRNGSAAPMKRDATEENSGTAQSRGLAEEG